MLIANARELSIDARPENDSGDLILRPVFSGDFPGLSADEIERRLGQLSGDAPRVVFRVGQTIVLPDPTQTHQARAIVDRGRVPQTKVDAFLKAPSAWSPQPDDQDEGAMTPVVPMILANDTELDFGWRESEMDQDGTEPDFSRYARDPMEHQRKAVLWLLSHAHRALRRREFSDEISGLGAGALLADDMGLGKTFSTLIFLREWFDLWRAWIGGEPPAVLIVAPLSLLENWKAEIAKSYGEGGSVFRRVLLAQPDGELNRVRRRPGSCDKAVPGEVLEYGLGFGDGTDRSVDLPGSCVLTTYQTLRDYRFSFAKAEWCAAIFDEAQNIKNPNALQTIAAKSLKALFRLTLTGTPVENHLGDFWFIMDTSEPGPLGSFVEFRENWITPMIREHDAWAKSGYGCVLTLAT